jgi:hypothetical protein
VSASIYAQDSGWTHTNTGTGTEADPNIIDSTSTTLQAGTSSLIWRFTASAAGTFYYSFTFANHELGTGFNGVDYSPYGVPSEITITGSLAVTSGQTLDVTILRPDLTEDYWTTSLHGSVYLI